MQEAPTVKQFVASMLGGSVPMYIFESRLAWIGVPIVTMTITSTALTKIFASAICGKGIETYAASWSGLDW